MHTNEIKCNLDEGCNAVHKLKLTIILFLLSFLFLLLFLFFSSFFQSINQSWSTVIIYFYTVILPSSSFLFVSCCMVTFCVTFLSPPFNFCTFSKCWPIGQHLLKVQKLNGVTKKLHKKLPAANNKNAEDGKSIQYKSIGQSENLEV